MLIVTREQLLGDSYLYVYMYDSEICLRIQPEIVKTVMIACSHSGAAPAVSELELLQSQTNECILINGL